MRGSHSPPDTSMPVWPWRQPPPPAPQLTDAPGLRPGPRFNPMVGHSHFYRPQPFPGAPAYAFETLGLAEFSPIGAAVVNRRQFNVLPPPTSFAALGVPTQGLGGLSMGQVIFGPLVVPDQYSFDGLGLDQSGVTPRGEYGV